MVLECCWDFVGYGAGAAIKHHSRASRKRQRALCPIHTLQCVNRDRAARWCLTGFGQTSGEAVPSLETNRKISARPELFVARGHLSQWGDEYSEPPSHSGIK